MMVDDHDRCELVGECFFWTKCCKTVVVDDDDDDDDVLYSQQPLLPVLEFKL